MIVIQMGTVTGYDTGDFLNIKNVQVLQVIVEGEQDATPALLINPAMDESAPKKDDRVLILRLGNFSIAIGGIDGLAPETAEGEKKLYSRDGNGDIAAFILLLSSGIMELNGNGDNAVRFSKLDDQITILNSKYDSHIHPDPVSGSTGIPTVSLGLDISDAKIDTITVPGVSQ